MGLELLFFPLFNSLRESKVSGHDHKGALLFQSRRNGAGQPPGAEDRKQDATEDLATRAKSQAAKKKRRGAITRGTEVTQLAGGCGLAWFLVLSMKMMTYLNKHTTVQRQTH